MMAEGRGGTGRNKRQERGHEKGANRRGNRHSQAAFIRRAMNLPEAWEGFTNKQEGKLRETDPTNHRIKFLNWSSWKRLTLNGKHANGSMTDR